MGEVLDDCIHTEIRKSQLGAAKPVEQNEDAALLAEGKKGKGKKQVCTSSGGGKGKGKGKQGKGLFQGEVLKLSEDGTLCSCVSKEEEEGEELEHGNISRDRGLYG